MIYDKKGSFLFDAKSILYLGLFLLAAMNFMGNFYYYVFAALLVHFITDKNIRVDSSIIWYVLFTIVYAAYGLDTGMMTIVRRSTYVVCYIIGFDLMLFKKQDARFKYKADETWLKSCVVSLALGTWLHLLLNFYINRGSVGNRNTIDIWTGQMWSATGQTALAILMIAVGIVLFLIPKNKRECLFAIAAITVIVMYNFILGGRTILILSGIIFVVCLLYVLHSKQIPSGSKIGALWAAGILVTSIVLIVVFDIAGIKTALLDTNLVNRFSETETSSEFLQDGRFEKKINYVQHMFEYPFGGLNLRKQYGHAHSLLLDSYDECGLLILFALIGIIGCSIADMKKIITCKKLGYQIKGLVLCVNIIILIEFTLEPILVGMPWLFACYALINGCVHGIVRK